jgi:DNA repair exonuclease SbcCD nuclease subunit
MVSAFADISPVAIVIGTPSHDGMAPEILRYARGKYDVLVASHPKQVYLEDGFLFDRPAGDREPEAVVTLIPAPTKQFFQTIAGIKESDQEIGQIMSALFAGFGAQAAVYKAPHILVGHWNVSGSKLPSGQVRTGMDIESSTDQMMLCNPDLICLGHIHQQQQLGDRTFFSGPIYATKIDEQGPNGFYIHVLATDVDGVALASEFSETPCKKMMRLSDDFSVPDNDHRRGLTITECLIGGEALSLRDVGGAYVRHEIKVYQDEAVQIDKPSIEEFYKAAGALDVDIRIIRVPRETVRSESVLKAERLRDKMIAMAEIKGETVPESILAKADLLESMGTEDLIETIGRAA